MADLGDNFLQGYFKTMEMRQNMVNRQTQAQQFAQEMQLRQQEAGQRQAQFQAQQNQWASELKDKESLRSEQSRKEQLSEKMDLARGLASGQFRLPSAPGNPNLMPQMTDQAAAPAGSQIQRVPGAPGQPAQIQFLPQQSSPTMIPTNIPQQEPQAPTFEMAGQQVRLSSPEEISQRKVAEQRAEAVSRASAGADAYSAFEAQAARLGIPAPSEDTKGRVFAYFGAGGGAPGSELAKLFETSKSAKAGKSGLGDKVTPSELYAYNLQHRDALHARIYDTLRANPQAMNDPEFAESARQVLAADQKQLEGYASLGPRVTAGALDTRQQREDEDFNKIAAAMGPSSLYKDAGEFNKKLQEFTGKNKLSSRAVSRYVQTQAASDKRVKTSILEQLGISNTAPISEDDR